MPNQATAYFQGYPISDSTRRMTIRITLDDIQNAIPDDPSHCAVANTARRAFDADDVRVFRTICYVRIGDEVFRFAPSKALITKVIYPLDTNRTPEPGFYELMPPAPSDRLGESVKRRKEHEERLARGEEVVKRQRRTYKRRKLITSRMNTVFWEK